MLTTKDLISGLSRANAIEWVKPFLKSFHAESEIKVRPLFEAEDFGADFAPELRGSGSLHAQMHTVAELVLYAARNDIVQVWSPALST